MSESLMSKCCVDTNGLAIYAPPPHYIHTRKIGVTKQKVKSSQPIHDGWYARALNLYMI